MLTTEQTATELGISRRRVQSLIRAGKLKATRFGRAWGIEPASLSAVRVRKPGRPKKGK